ncbi:MAG: reverse transcriptase domain-containing protein, partial [Pseudomonadota bacterium]
KMRPLGIPTIKDRALQAAVKSVLEPYWEARFEPNSYGFRPAYGCHDAIDAITKSLVISKKGKWVLDADITGCFDNIDHEALLSKLNTQWRGIINQWLKAGYMERGEFNSTKAGTPQGGTISPLLANIALDRMETDLIEHLRCKCGNKLIGNPSVSCNVNKDGTKTWYQKSLKVTIVRYADDFVVIHEDESVVREAKSYLKEWLKGVGLELSDEKTKVVRSTEGFDFLGCHFRHYLNNKLSPKYKSKLLQGTKTEQNRARAKYVFRVEPTKAKIISHWRDISTTVKRMNSASAKDLINVLQPKISGWANYYATVHSHEVFSKLDFLLWKRLWRWVSRKHPLKNAKWRKEHYYRYHDGRNWSFVYLKGGEIVKAIKPSLNRPLRSALTPIA